MYWDGALGAAVEVAIAIAGFSGIVAAVGRRSPGSWTADDQLRLRVLLTSSASAGLFAFIPFILFETGLSAPVCWRLGSAAQVVWFVGIFVYRRRQALQAGASDPAKLAPIWLVFIVVVGAGQVVNAVYAALSWVYIVGVVFQLVLAFSAFTALLLDSRRE